VFVFPGATAVSTKTLLPRRRQLISLAAAADYADVHPRTVRRWIASGVLTGYRAGPRMIKVDADELDAMIRAIPTAGDASC
jgi:excisionase family DNA binding protein